MGFFKSKDLFFGSICGPVVDDNNLLLHVIDQFNRFNSLQHFFNSAAFIICRNNDGKFWPGHWVNIYLYFMTNPPNEAALVKKLKQAKKIMIISTIVFIVC